jgi:hypothetical protein
MGGQYARQRLVLTLGAELATAGILLTALADCIDCAGPIPPGWKYFFLL